MGLGAFSKTVRHHGSVWKCIKNLYYRDCLKYGKLVGTDTFGNRYYENNDYFVTSNRWVEYADHVGLNYDPSQIPAEWFGWLHHRTDLLPDQEPFRPKYHWMLPHEENMTGTRLQYVPYTTTRPKILPWVPPRASPSSDSDGDSRSGCGEKGEGKPSPKGEEKHKSASMSEQEETPQMCEKKQEEKKCDEEKRQIVCEKPIKAFH